MPDLRCLVCGSSSGALQSVVDELANSTRQGNVAGNSAPSPGALAANGVTSATTALGDDSAAFGQGSLALGEASFASGIDTQAGAVYSAAFNQETQAAGDASFSSGFQTIAGSLAGFAQGYRSLAELGLAEHAHGSGSFSGVADHDAIYSRTIARREITGAAGTELFLDGAALRLSIPAARTFSLHINAVARGTNHVERAAFIIHALIEDGAVIGQNVLNMINTGGAGGYTLVVGAPGGNVVTLTATAAGAGGGDITRWVAVLEVTIVGQ